MILSVKQVWEGAGPSRGLLKGQTPLHSTLPHTLQTLAACGHVSPSEMPPMNVPAETDLSAFTLRSDFSAVWAFDLCICL